MSDATLGLIMFLVIGGAGLIAGLVIGYLLGKIERTKKSE